MIELSGHLAQLSSILAAAPTDGGIPAPTDGPAWFGLIPGLALLGSIAALVMMFFRVKSKAPAWTVVTTLGASFVLTLIGFIGWYTGDQLPQVSTLWTWISTSWGSEPGQSFHADIGFYMDGLSWLWMLFVTGLATLIGLYANEYMAGDRGYARFFAAFGLFVMSMACLVMGDNLVLLYLGWEGVGLCSYLLIGHYYRRPAAVAAAKKAFIINRIGDLGLALGLFLVFTTYGTIRYEELFALIPQGVDIAGASVTGQWTEWAIPCLLMLGAFGKSAQLFFYVWLPDAMEGPTPVSALIHAATMVTAGVYLIARMYPLFAADPNMVALTIVAWAGVITAFWAATIEMAMFDIKRVMGYSTVSQLGFMFAALGLLGTTAACFHVFTHAFFKASLFLGVGCVMHGFGGQLDLRKLSGVMWMSGFRIVGIVMLIGCINLSGVPMTAGYFSKDMILAQAFTTPGALIPGAQWIAWLLLITAGMTAYYTFRVFFRVFVGPKKFYPGDDPELLALGRHPKGEPLHHGHHGEHEHGHGHDDESPDSIEDLRTLRQKEFDPETEEFDPHPPGRAMNIVLIILMVCTLAASSLYFINKADHGWVGSIVHHSTADYPAPGDSSKTVIAPDGSEHAVGTFLGFDPHKAMYYVSAVVGLIGILIAAYLHGPKGAWGLFLGNRTRTDKVRCDAVAARLGPIPRWAENKWYVDEFYDFIIRKPLWMIGNIFHLIDKLIVDGLVNGAGLAPRAIAQSLRPSQNGILQSYAVAMACGVGVILLIAFLLTT
ncbi:MAG: NADH-quinone oxidoreductase subunit L [Phycisphaeraceae bacterium]|nr:MAG: NADH-quinone oxidoreductase subunit L [Phycisphaeraceae bacterium]